MWSRNKPSDWLSTQSENDKSEILNRAQKLAPKYLEVFQDRQRQIQAQITQKLEDKKVKNEKTGGTKLNNKISISREISKYGGVWCKSEIETKLQELNKKVNPSKCVREALLSNQISQKCIKFQRS
jgi:hypothetical protein